MNPQSSFYINENIYLIFSCFIFHFPCFPKCYLWSVSNCIHLQCSHQQCSARNHELFCEVATLLPLFSFLGLHTLPDTFSPFQFQDCFKHFSTDSYSFVSKQSLLKIKLFLYAHMLEWKIKNNLLGHTYMLNFDSYCQIAQ